MKKIIYIPLDERPCNRLFPSMIVSTQANIELITPVMGMLSHKKKEADTEELWHFVFSHINECEALVFSLEMLGYGGLLPSRLHHRDLQQRKVLIERIKRLKIMAPEIKIYMSTLIMRTPQYNSSDEEPDYYENYGYALFRKAYLTDKWQREELTEEEQKELELIDIPSQFQQDYEERRLYNRDTLLEVLDLVKGEVIDFMVIPQDDSAPYGYTAMDQQTVTKKISELRLQRKVLMYPGADESGATLLSRCFNEMNHQCPKIYPYFASTLGPTIIPKYEDRPMYESLKAHIIAAGAQEVMTSQEADFILAINAPGKIMEEAPKQGDKDITYTSYRHLLSFVEHIKTWLDQGKPVVLADCAFINGGEIELVSLLDDMEILDKLISYKGWNTYWNSLGTSIAQGVFGYQNSDAEKIKHHLLYHLFDDLFYQALIRPQITSTLEARNLSYFNLKSQAANISKEIERYMNKYYDYFIQNSFKNIEILKLEAYSPWNRMFEVGLNLKIGMK